MTQNLPDELAGDLVGENSPEIELTDDDILDAMHLIPGYLDITTEDFRSIYHLAYRHALERMFVGADGLLDAPHRPAELPERQQLLLPVVVQDVHPRRGTTA